MLVELDSSTTLLILLFHGVKREITAPPPGRATHGQTLDGLACVSTAEWVRSAESCAVCAAHDARLSRMHAASSKSADRPQIIPIPLHSVRAWPRCDEVSSD
jgi:hypothetical protein